MKNIKQLLNARYILGLVVALIIIYILSSITKSDNTTYEIVLVKRGNIKSVVNTTGTIEPQLKVELIPKVSGIIKEVYVDYNSLVKKGDILALINKEEFLLNIKQSEASFLKAKSDLEYNRNIYESNKKLYEKNLISHQELKNSKVNYSSSLALYEQANASLEISKSDLSNTEIKSPIDGIVIGIGLTAGQVVSDTLDQKPIFTIVNNLVDMNIIAPVNEVDIGKINIENDVNFITDAYPEIEYKGRVKQIVSLPTSTNNIVTYNIIVQFENQNNLLKPGMTANLEIVAKSKSDILLVPKSSLSFTPSSYSQLAKEFKLTDGDKVVWTLNTLNKLKAVKVMTGVSDATSIEIIDGDLKENDRVIVGLIKSDNLDNNSSGPIKIPGVKRF